MKKTKGFLKLGVLGASGKMGQAIEQVLLTTRQNGGQSQLKSIHPYLAIGKTEHSIYSIACVDLSSVESDVLEDVDVWIDFSSPQGLKTLIEKTKNQNTPIVSGTTGLSKKDWQLINKTATQRPIFWASNMSPGLWAFRQALKALSSIREFDFAIEEVHHTQKKDKPSGTALTLKSDLEKALEKNISEPTSLRLGGVFGVHRVLGASAHETISFEHQALGRSVFAEGAMKAALWLQKQKNGLYSIDDLFTKK